MKALFLTLLLCYSCTKYASFSKEAVGISIHPVQMKVSYLDEIEWHIGQKKEETVTQSITFIVDLPKMRDEDLNFLTEQKGIDAWIVRLVASRGSKIQDLGSLYALFKPKKASRASISSATSSVVMKVFYAAAFASERFRAQKCPAFNHRKRIRKMEIQGEDEEFSLSINQVTSYEEKSQLVELAPTAFNAGHSLVGDYFIEIAPYDSKKRLIHSNFKRIPMNVSVTEENEVKVLSCEGVNPEA
jgi:hypothetical protein